MKRWGMNIYLFFEVDANVTKLELNSQLHHWYNFSTDQRYPSMETNKIKWFLLAVQYYNKCCYLLVRAVMNNVLVSTQFLSMPYWTFWGMKMELQYALPPSFLPVSRSRFLRLDAIISSNQCMYQGPHLSMLSMHKMGHKDVYATRSMILFMPFTSVLLGKIVLMYLCVVCTLVPGEGRGWLCIPWAINSGWLLHLSVLNGGKLRTHESTSFQFIIAFACAIFWWPDWIVSAFPDRLSHVKYLHLQ